MLTCYLAHSIAISLEAIGEELGESIRRMGTTPSDFQSLLGEVREGYIIVSNMIHKLLNLKKEKFEEFQQEAIAKTLDEEPPINGRYLTLAARIIIQDSKTRGYVPMLTYLEWVLREAEAQLSELHFGVKKMIEAFSTRDTDGGDKTLPSLFPCEQFGEEVGQSVLDQLRKKKKQQRKKRQQKKKEHPVGVVEQLASPPKDSNKAEPTALSSAQPASPSMNIPGSKPVHPGGIPASIPDGGKLEGKEPSKVDGSPEYHISVRKTGSTDSPLVRYGSFGGSVPSLADEAEEDEQEEDLVHLNTDLQQLQNILSQHESLRGGMKSRHFIALFAALNKRGYFKDFLASDKEVAVTLAPSKPYPQGVHLKAHLNHSGKHKDSGITEKTAEKAKDLVEALEETVASQSDRPKKEEKKPIHKKRHKRDKA